MARAADLVDEGLRAFTLGQKAEAERCWRAAIALEPANDRARRCLELLAGGDATTASPSPWDDGPAAAPSIVLDADGGLDLDAVADTAAVHTLVPDRERPALTPLPQRADIDVWMAAARDLFALGDFSGSLEMIEKILKLNPSHAEARAYLAQNEATLVAMYESKLGPLSGVPRLAIKPEEVMWLSLDHRAGFLLAQVDGVVTYEDLFALSGLPRLDTAKILATLLQDGVITSAS